MLARKKKSKKYSDSWVIRKYKIKLNKKCRYVDNHSKYKGIKFISCNSNIYIF